MPIPPLPIELFFYIFEYVNNQITIFQCLLVCRGWYTYLLGRLYRHPSLYHRRQLHGFNDTLAKTTFGGPTFGGLIKLDILFSITDDTLLEILKRYGKSLVSLKLDNCSQLTCDALTFDRDLCPNLCNVGFKSLASLSMRRRALINFIRNYPALKYLDISYSIIVVNDATMQSLRGLRSLRVLNLSGNKCVTDEGLLAATTAMPELEELQLAHLEKVTKNGIVALTRSCPGIRRLDLSYTKVSEAVLRVLAEQLRLEEVDVDFCDGVTPEMVQRWLPGVSQFAR